MAAPADTVDWSGRLRVAVPTGKAVGRLSRLLGRGAGSVIGGKVAMTIEPEALRRLAAGRTVAVVSGTNGKTTTSRLLAAALGTRGAVCLNQTGSNMPTGLVAALAADPTAPGAVLETDERYVPAVREATGAAVVVLLNLSRDQLDRMGEVRSLAERWRRMCEADPTIRVVANADDPLVVWAARPARTVWVGPALRWEADAQACPACGSRIRFTPQSWACERCTLHRPHVTYQRTGNWLRGPDHLSLELDLDLPFGHVLANASLAVAAAEVLGITAAEAIGAMATVGEADGRYRRVWGERRLFLAKNPAGWHEILEVVRNRPGTVLLALNCNGPDGRDPSWLYDAPFERLAGKPVLVTGERWRDLSVRLRYAGVEHEPIASMAEALGEARSLDADVVASYTAFYAAKGLLEKGRVG